MQENNENFLPEWNEIPDIDLYMDQVITFINKYLSEGELTSSMINNYVKSGIIKSPVKKKYSKISISRLIIICALKPVLPINSIDTLLKLFSEKFSDEEIYNFFLENYISSYEMVKNALDKDNENLYAVVLKLAAVSCISKNFSEKLLKDTEKSQV